MSFFKNIQISKYKKIMEQIENLNKRNVKGYDSFAEYCIADEIMIRYFYELKKIEKKLPSLTVDSYEKFEQNTFDQLNEIYEKNINKIFEKKDYSISNEEFLKQKLNKLEDLKRDILNGYGHKCDKMLDAFIQDINDKIKNYDRYEYSIISGKYTDDFDDLNSFNNEGEDPYLKDVMRYIMKVKEASISSIIEIYDLKYSRLSRILSKLRDMGIIEEYSFGEPIRIKKYIKYVVSTDNIKKMTTKEYEKQREKIRREKMSLEEIMKIYNIEIDYSNGTDISKINNSLIINNECESIAINNLEYLLKHNSPDKLGIFLINTNNICFNYYEDVPNSIVPIESDINKILSILQYCEQIIDNRYNLLLAKKVKDIQDIKDEEIQNIIIFIDELGNLQKNKKINEHLLKILLKGKKVGITCLMYSKFSKKNLNLGYIEDLIKIYNEFNIENVLSGEVDSIEIDKIDSDMDGYDFENCSTNLLLNNGFSNVEVTQYSGDFGVDIIAYKDDVKYAIQCKKYSSPVGIKAVQEVIASKAMNDCHVAVVLTNNYFTSSAKELAKKNNVLLWDRNKLKKLIDNMPDLNNE